MKFSITKVEIPGEYVKEYKESKDNPIDNQSEELHPDPPGQLSEHQPRQLQEVKNPNANNLKNTKSIHDPANLK